ncbi:V-type ATP synthase subunit E [Thermus composti]|uniref:V-type proton ATPase subunit E n=1 Tax=Thermus composti TaxID=532059 RepID=A0ABV6Q3G0_9DEIN|nr:V-type ATP synthase subunit E family protein [Thermus composti]GGM94537.1 V-type ATP synthase subunit E [Thermus composti]
MSKLESILTQEVEAEIRSILEEAKAKAEALKEEAKAKAEALLAAKERALKAQYQAALRRAESAGELLLATRRAEAKGEVLEAVKAKALEVLRALPQKPEWPEVVRKLALEALSALPAPQALASHPENLPHLEALAREKGLSLKEDPALRLGVRVMGGDGKTQVENNLEARLDRAWDTLSSRVAQVLWG